MPLMGILDMVDDFWMSWAANAEAWTYLAFQSQKICDLTPHRNGSHELRIAHDIEAVSRSATGNVGSIRCLQKADTSGIVASHSTENNNLGFFTLEIVNGSQSQHITNFDGCLHAILEIL